MHLNFERGEFRCWLNNSPDRSDPHNHYIGFGFAWQHVTHGRVLWSENGTIYGWRGFRIVWEKWLHWPRISIGTL